MEANFARALAWVRVSEGGNDDDPDDSGGRTSRGITQREYNAYCRMARLPVGDVWQAPDPVIDDIYHKSYWNPWCPVLPPGVDYMFFDHAVLAGPNAAVVCLQRALGVSADGHIGLVTSEALTNAKLPDLVDAMAAERMRVYRAIIAEHPVDRKFYRGWSNRVVFAQKNAHTLLPAVPAVPA
jgi:lysozyme family protein